MRKARANLISTAFFAAATLLMTYPLMLNMGSGIKDTGDPLLSSWIMAWNVEKITHLDMTNIFNANIFFPQKRTIAYSEFLFTQSLISLPARLATGNPIFAQNFVILFSFLTSGLGMYFLARYLTKSVFGGIIAGVIYAFSPFMISHLSHLQILTAGGIPLAFLYLHKFFEGEHFKHILLFTVFFILNALANGYYGLYVVLFAGLYLMLYILFRKKFTDWRFWLKVATFVLLVLVVTGPIVHQYLVVRKEMGFVRSIGSYADLTSFLSTAPYNKVYGNLFARFSKPEGQLFPGIVAVLLAVIGLMHTLKKRRSGIPYIQTPFHFYSLVLLLSFLFTFGPKGPYILLYKYVPGFNAIRVASRFHVLVMFSLAILAAYGTKAVISSPRFQRKWVSIVLACFFIILLLIEYYSLPIPWKKIPAKDDIPEVYKWLAAQKDDFAIIELPLPEPGESTFYKECPRMYYSTYHWKKLVNGYAGYFPPLYYELKWRWKTQPLASNISDLRTLGVRSIILHSSFYEEKELRQILSDFSKLEENVKLVRQVGDAFVYEVIPGVPDPVKETSLQGLTLIPKTDWTVDANENRGNVEFTIDGDPSTRWHIGGRDFDVYFEFDLGRVHTLKGLSMNSGTNSLHYPRSYRVELSLDGAEWTVVARKDNILPPITLFLKPKELSLAVTFPPTPARHIRFVNTEKKLEDRWWSIYEIDFFE